MKVNWKVRFKNKIWLSAFISAIIIIMYTIFDLIGFIPDISEFSLTRIVEAVLLLLSLTGVIVDPTTAGFGDSNRAQGYVEPWNDNLEAQEDGGNG
jgi:phi LC3 family holin